MNVRIDAGWCFRADLDIEGGEIEEIRAEPPHGKNRRGLLNSTVAEWRVTISNTSPSGGSVGIGFAIPADTVKSVVDQLKQSGTVTRGWIGVQVQTVTQDIADSMGLKKTEGALVAEPQADGRRGRSRHRAFTAPLAFVGGVVRGASCRPEKPAPTRAGSGGAYRLANFTKDMHRQGTREPRTDANSPGRIARCRRISRS